MRGVPLKHTAIFGAPGESYVFDTKRKASETIAPLLDRGSPLRTSHMRDPGGPQTTFAVESFMDELALATNTDPVEFRLRYLKDARDIAVVKAAAEEANWKPRASRRHGHKSTDLCPWLLSMRPIEASLQLQNFTRSAPFSPSICRASAGVAT
jgi:hypothetical protein